MATEEFYSLRLRSEAIEVEVQSTDSEVCRQWFNKLIKNYFNFEVTPIEP